MPGYALTEIWIYLKFLISQDSEYGRFSICKCYTGFQICHNMAEYVWTEREYAWIYDNRTGSEYVSYNI